jgi:hypothetical protein
MGKTMGNWVRRVFFMGILISLVPYFILAFFSYPSTDDFAYATKVLDYGFWAGQIETYNTWSGRYFATLLLSFNPVAQKWIWGFPLLPIALLLGLWGSLWYALNSVLHGASTATDDDDDDYRSHSLLSKKQIFLACDRSIFSLSFTYSDACSSFLLDGRRRDLHRASHSCELRSRSLFQVVPPREIVFSSLACPLDICPDHSGLQ